MGVLLRLGDAQLGETHLTEILAQAVFHGVAGIGHLDVWHGGVVLRVAHECDGEELAGEAVKGRVHQGAGDLPGPVGPEVEKDDAVVVGDGALAVADHGLHELVGDPGGVGGLHSGRGIGVGDGALAVDHGVIGLLHPVPALVAVHGVVAAHDRGDLPHADLGALLYGLGHEVLAAGGRHIPAVQERVDIDLLQPPALGHLQKGPEVGVVGVDAPIGEKAVEVEGVPPRLAGVHGGHVGFVFKEGAVLDGPGNPGQVLVDNPTSADVGVAHLAVAHLPVGEPHVQPGGGEGGVGAGG